MSRFNQHGFSMVEVLITLMVISMAFISLSSLHDTTNALAGKGSVNAYASDALDRFSTLYDNQLTTSPNLGLTATGGLVVNSDPNSNTGLLLFSPGGAGLDAVNALRKLPSPATANIKICYVDLAAPPASNSALGSVCTYGIPSAMTKVVITVRYGPTPQKTRSTVLLLASNDAGGSH